MPGLRRRDVALLVAFGPLLVAFLVTAIFFRAFWIPTGSMKPSLLVGDYLLVNRAVYGFPQMMCTLGQCDGDMGPWGHAPERGDIVTFLHPENGNSYIKRVIGLPGDKIRVEAGIIHLNGTALQTDPLGTFEEPYLLEHGYLACKNAPVPIGEICVKDQTRERLPDGRGYLTINIADGLKADHFAEVEVPPAHLFVMGDNRDNSLDSRFPISAGGVGFIPVDRVIGRADIVLFSLTGQKGRVLQWVE